MRDLRHLRGVIAHLTGSQGLCIHRSAAMVLDLPGAVLCFGVFRAATLQERAENPLASCEPFIHAWVEYRGSVYAPTTIERFGGLTPMSMQDYYDANGATGIRRMTRPELLKISGNIGLSAHFRLGKPARASVGGTLLDAVGMRYRISPEGGLLPD